MLRTNVCLFAIGLLVGMSVRGTFANDRPNVIVIMADDIGAEGLACYGSTICTTPHLDRMASRNTQTDHFPSALEPGSSSDRSEGLQAAPDDIRLRFDQMWTLRMPDHGRAQDKEDEERRQPVCVLPMHAVSQRRPSENSADRERTRRSDARHLRHASS